MVTVRRALDGLKAEIDSKERGETGVHEAIVELTEALRCSETGGAAAAAAGEGIAQAVVEGVIVGSEAKRVRDSLRGFGDGVVAYIKLLEVCTEVREIRCFVAPRDYWAVVATFAANSKHKVRTQALSCLESLLHHVGIVDGEWGITSGSADGGHDAEPGHLAAATAAVAGQSCNDEHWQVRAGAVALLRRCLSLVGTQWLPEPACCFSAACYLISTVEDAHETVQKTTADALASVSDKLLAQLVAAYPASGVQALVARCVEECFDKESQSCHERVLLVVNRPEKAVHGAVVSADACLKLIRVASNYAERSHRSGGWSAAVMSMFQQAHSAFIVEVSNQVVATKQYLSGAVWQESIFDLELLPPRIAVALKHVRDTALMHQLLVVVHEVVSQCHSTTTSSRHDADELLAASRLSGSSLETIHVALAICADLVSHMRVLPGTEHAASQAIIAETLSVCITLVKGMWNPDRQLTVPRIDSIDLIHWDHTNLVANSMQFAYGSPAAAHADTPMSVSEHLTMSAFQVATTLCETSQLLDGEILGVGAVVDWLQVLSPYCTRSAWPTDAVPHRAGQLALELASVTSSGSLDLVALVHEHGEALVHRMRESMREYRDSRAARWTFMWWFFQCDRHVLNERGLMHALPIVLELLNSHKDVEVWVGLSCLLHLCNECLATHLQHHRGVITDALQSHIRTNSSALAVLRCCATMRVATVCRASHYDMISTANKFVDDISTASSDSSRVALTVALQWSVAKLGVALVRDVARMVDVLRAFAISSASPAVCKTCVEALCTVCTHCWPSMNGKMVERLLGTAIRATMQAKMLCESSTSTARAASTEVWANWHSSILAASVRLVELLQRLGEPEKAFVNRSLLSLSKDEPVLLTLLRHDDSVDTERRCDLS